MEDLITIGFKKGEADFSVNCSIKDLTIEQLNELRQIIPVAICQAENMWSRANEIIASENIKEVHNASRI